MGTLIASYLFDEKYVQQKVVLIIDANVGMTDRDLGMFDELRSHPKDLIIVASKIDKLKHSEYQKKIGAIQELVGEYPVFPISATENKGIDALAGALFI